MLKRLLFFFIFSTSFVSAQIDYSDSWEENAEQMQKQCHKAAASYASDLQVERDKASESVQQSEVFSRTKAQMVALTQMPCPFRLADPKHNFLPLWTRPNSSKC